MIKKSTIITLVFVALGIQNTFAQVFPSPASLSTGKGAPGSNDPIWLVSQQCFSSAPPNPTSASVTFSPAVIQNPYNAAWINPSTLPAPVNNGDWIGFSSTSGSGDNSGCYRYYRLPITLPANCGVQSVTVAGSYVLTFDGYVDNTISAVYVNGVNMGIAAGGGFSAGTQLTFSLPGPWLVGLNYIDIQVFNGPLTSPDPSGLLLVASPSAGSADSDGDGVSNINDACPCIAGTTYNGCPAPNNCNLTAIRSAYTSAGCTELASCYDGCSLYFYYPIAGTSSAAESFAQTLGGHIVSIQSATENVCLSNELNAHGYSGVIWIGYTDVVTEGTFLWLDGSPFGYTNWNAGEPNNGGGSGSENCTQMYPSGKWNDLNCALGAASILEVGLCPQATIVAPTPQFCLGASTALSVSTVFGSAPYSYTWSPAAGLSATNFANPIASPSVTTTYTATSIDRYGCTAYAYTTITINPLPLVTVNSSTICQGQQTATLTANGATSYTWSAGLSSTSGTSVNGSPFTTTSYTVRGSDVNGCIGKATTTITVNSLPIITATSGTICIGQQTVALTTSGGVTYSWTPATGLSATTGSTVNASPIVTTTYSVGGINANGCANFTTTIVTVRPLPIITATSGTICVGQQTVALTASGGVTYSWTPATGLSATFGSTVNASPLVTTTYSVGGVDANGCANYTTTTVTVKPLPVLSANNATICIGQQTATITANGGVTYSWTPATGLSATTGSVVNANPTTSTTYSIGGVGANGCLNYTTSFITVKPLPLISVNSSSICLGQQTATLTANGAATYSWTPAATLSSSVGTTVNGTPTVNTTYTIVGTDANGCVNGTTTFIRIYPLPTASLSINTNTICIGSTVTITPSGANSYVLTPGNLFSTSNYVLTPTVNTVYSVVGTNTNNCFSTNNPTVAVTVYTLPIISAQSDATINIGQTTTVTASGGLTYLWSPADGLACASCATTAASPYVTTIYIVKGFDMYGCKNMDTVVVKVDYICADFFVPNVFSPNGDGLNDVVNIHGACIASYNFQIFNRWGELVFETKDPAVSWDGTFRGKPMDTGVFMYSADGITRDGSPFSAKGNITLLR